MFSSFCARMFSWRAAYSVHHVLVSPGYHVSMMSCSHEGKPFVYHVIIFPGYHISHPSLCTMFLRYHVVMSSRRGAFSVYHVLMFFHVAMLSSSHEGHPAVRYPIPDTCYLSRVTCPHNSWSCQGRTMSWSTFTWTLWRCDRGSSGSEEASRFGTRYTYGVRYPS